MSAPLVFTHTSTHLSVPASLHKPIFVEWIQQMSRGLEWDVCSFDPLQTHLVTGSCMALPADEFRHALEVPWPLDAEDKNHIPAFLQSQRAF